MASERGWFGPALALVGAVVAFRLVLLPFSQAELFVDEAQYWLWGQELAFGYYSKPPMIGWLIRAVTDLAGSDSAFWVRMPGAVLHGITALLLAGIAAELWDRRAALAVAASYITLPMVAVGSFLISTDTVMFPFLAGALWAWLRALRERGAAAALLAGAALGLAVMSKYAGLYYVLCGGLAALAMPAAWPGWRQAALALGALAVVVSPNMIWNIQNGLSTLEHTMDNADWVRDPAARAGLDWWALAEFFGSQFVVFGPLLFGALIALAARWRRQEEAVRLLLWFAVPIVLLVCGQALLSGAYANWAAAAYLAGTLVAAPVLLRAGRLWLYASLALGAAFAVFLPLATLTAGSLRLNAEAPLLLERYVGREKMSATILDLAEKAGTETIVADDRDVLADLFYRLRGEEVRGGAKGFAVYARPEAGRAPNHYVQEYAFPGSADEVLYITRSHEVPGCGGSDLGHIAPQEGAYRQRPQTAWLVPGDCWAEGKDGQ